MRLIRVRLCPSAPLIFDFDERLIKMRAIVGTNG
jgi:hypothetical protein